MFQDAGIVTEEDKDTVIDKWKVRREKKKLGNKMEEEEDLEIRKIKSVLFDGRKNKTIFIEKKRKQEEPLIKSRRTYHRVVGTWFGLFWSFDT